MTQKILPIDITPKALEEIKHTIEKKNIPEGYGLRVGVRGGLACGGTAMTHILGFDKEKEGDDVHEMDGITIYIKKKDALYLAGLTIDYYEGADAKGFTFVAGEN